MKAGVYERALVVPGPTPCSTPELCATGVLLPLFITLSLSSIITIAILVTKSIPKDGVDLCVQGAGETGDQGLKADFVQWTHSGLAATRGGNIQRSPETEGKPGWVNSVSGSMSDGPHVVALSQPAGLVAGMWVGVPTRVGSGRGKLIATT